MTYEIAKVGEGVLDEQSDTVLHRFFFWLVLGLNSFRFGVLRGVLERTLRRYFGRHREAEAFQAGDFLLYLWA